MSTTEATFDEVLDLMTGYDELAVKQVTGVPVAKLLEEDALQATRAVIAVHKAREDNPEGYGPKEYGQAYKVAMGMPFKEVREYFTPEPQDPDPDDPDSPAGKDESTSNGKTTT